MKFILIVISTINSNGINNVSMQEFDSKIQCEYAAKIINSQSIKYKPYIPYTACIYK